MKQFVIALLAVLLALSGYAQPSQPPSKGDVAKTVQALSSGDQKQTWAGLLSGFANLFGSSGNSVSFNPTLYAFMHLNKLKKVNYEDYVKPGQTFARNLQFNLSATPDNKNSFQVDSGAVGFKFAILNNQIASENDYKKLDKFLDKSSPDDLKTKLLDILRHKPIWTVSLNDNYGFLTKSNNSLNASSEYTQTMISFTRDTLYLDLTVSYTWQADTMQGFTNLHRNIYGANVGGNLTIPGNVPLEIKPSVSFVHIDGPLYKKESTNSFKANLTPRIQVNKQFWIPITISWDPKNGQIFGFLTVQYSFT